MGDFADSYIKKLERHDLLIKRKREAEEEFLYRRRIREKTHSNKLAGFALSNSNIAAKNVYKSHKGQQEVVIKIVSKGVGYNDALQLLKYISRTSETFKKDDVKPFDVFHSSGSLISSADLKQFIKGWEKDFQSKKFIQDNPKIAKEMCDIISKQNFLQTKQQEEGLSYREQEQLDLLKETPKKIESVKKFQYLKEMKIGGLAVDKNENIYSVNNIINQNVYVTNLEKGNTLKKKKSKLKAVEFYEEKKVNKVIPRDFTHIVLSSGGDNPDINKTQKAVDNFLVEQFLSKGFEYVYVMHNDTEHLHFHVMLKNHNHVTKKNLSFDKHDLYALRQEFTSQLDRYGIDRTATYRKERIQNRDKVDQGMIKFEKGVSWYLSRLRKNDKDEIDFDAFSYRINLLKQSQRLIDKLDKNCSGISDAERKVALKILKERKEAVMDLKPSDFLVMLRATERALAAENIRLSKDALKLKEPRFKDKHKDLFKTSFLKAIDKRFEELTQIDKELGGIIRESQDKKVILSAQLTQLRLQSVMRNVGKSKSESMDMGMSLERSKW